MLSQMEKKRRRMNRHYIKTRKMHKAFGSDIIKFMKSFKIDKPIAEAHNGSLNITEELTVTEIENFWLVKEIKTNDSYYVKNCNDDWSCSCGKLTSCGIHCSHMMKILIMKNILMETLSKLISKRWIISTQNLEGAIVIKSDELADFELETCQYQLSVKH